MAVYFIQVGEDGPIKIGIAGNVEARLMECQVGIPYELRVRAVIPQGDRQMERELHGRFQSHWIRGEWFMPHADLLEHIQKHGEPFVGRGVRFRKLNRVRAPLPPPLTKVARDTMAKLQHAIDVQDWFQTMPDALRKRLEAEEGLPL
jgi:hypothetical protein